jgi:hypothetical protein
MEKGGGEENKEEGFWEERGIIFAAERILQEL